jgi:dihydroorotase
VREEKALDLMTALKKMTLMPAQRLEKRAPMFKDKGRIRVGADADITVFNPDTVIDKATYEEPLQYSEGIEFVLVNGTLVVKDGKLVEGVFPGRAARAPISTDH